jgi:outer membrane protein TolC
LPHVDAKAAYQFLPKVPTIPADFMGGSGTSSGSSSSQPQTIELGVKHNVTFDFTASQLIFNGSYLVGLKAMKTLYRQSNESREKTILDVYESVNNTYYLILVAEESKKILIQNLENVRKTIYEISEMNKQGFVEKTDVDQLTLSENNILNALNQVQSNLEVAYRLFKIIVGIDLDKNIKLSDSIENNDAISLSTSKLISESFNIEKNIDFRTMKTATELAKLEFQNARAAYLPIISGFYNHTEKLNKPIFDFAAKDVIGINLSLPIFSSGQRMAVVSQKKLTIDKTDNSRKFVTNTLVMQADQFQTELRLKLEKYNIQTKSLNLADEIYKKTLEKYKNGVSSSMDLMTSQNQYLSTLTNYYQSIYDLEISKSKLEKLFNINQEINK